MQIHFYEVLKVVKITETESRMVVSSGWGKGTMGSYCIDGTEFQFYKMKRVLEMSDLMAAEHYEYI